jgi:cell division protein FtsI (penicillin-binding protein 3)
MNRPSSWAAALSSPLHRGRVLLAFWVIALLGLLGRAGEIQLRQGAHWRGEAERQHRAEGTVAAPRGSILDRDGSPLVVSHEVFRIGIAPHELSDRGAAAQHLVEALGIPAAEAERLTGSDRRWVQLPRVYPPRVREALAGVRGVHVERELRRFYPYGDLGRGILGVVLDGQGTGGIEQAFEDHLRGVEGRQVVSRDSGGRPIPGEQWILTPPRGGGDLVLTLDRNLQEIAREALEEAIRETGARGGDLLVTDPKTGELLAMVSLLEGSSNHLGGINTPYEPGSTLKPFTVAGLLELGLATLADSVDTENGRWQVAGRTISDVSRIGKATLADALRTSSNIGIAKAAQAYTPAQQYEVLRDFGFGVPTGIPLPGEASGLLRHPRQWSAQSGVSLSMGYEISVTPLQMAMAYGALANGGILMEPRLLREIRDAEGRVVERIEPREVRRVLSPAVVESIKQSLVEAVEDGTGSRARLATFAVAGKSGTARATGADGRYESGAYFASFVGFFPAERPQLVVFVKLDRPQGTYYGGATAAPVTRATMEAILAARRPPLDRTALAHLAQAQETERQAHAAAVAQAARELEGEDSRASAPGSAGATFTGAPPTSHPSPAPRRSGAAESSVRSVASPGAPVLVPETIGLPAREAIRRLHGLGLHVEWEGEGVVRATIPEAGERLVYGDTIRVVGVGLRSATGRGGAPGAPVSARRGGR